ncbi:MAG: GNAT family N-acetyltransferase [Ilumatobacteraceae bacterium]
MVDVPTPLSPIVLEGTTVRLEPLTLEHLGGLLTACSEPRDTFRFTWVPEATRPDVERYITVALHQHAQGTSLPFATRWLKSGEIVGSTRYMNIEYWANRDQSPSTSDIPDALEIGATWLAEHAQRTSVNTEAKLLMLTHAFEVLGVKRVNLRTDARNLKSRANIERVGATLDGILRHDRRSTDGGNGGLRDTATYSLLAHEWPAAKLSLQARLR